VTFFKVAGFPSVGGVSPISATCISYSEGVGFAGRVREAMEQLLIRAQEVAYRVSLLVCGHPEEAEDVMQDALVKTYQHVNRINQPDAFRTWLYTTVRNACLMKRRRRVGERSHFVSLEHGVSVPGGATAPLDVADQTRPIDQRLIDDWMDGRLRAGLKMLPARYRMIVVMREIEGLSIREVAAVTGYSEANVKTRLHRARRCCVDIWRGDKRVVGFTANS
jgi:RNA polymerase sigma-70 factor (ECF subfamily)